VAEQKSQASAARKLRAARSAEGQHPVRFRAEKRKKNRQKRQRLISLAVLIAAAALVLWGTFRRQPKEYLAGENTLAVHFIDVGQGDCTLCACGGEIMLIDSGEDQCAPEVVSYLRRRGIKRIDRLVATHPHSDHMGGMYRIAKAFDIGEVLMPHLTEADIPDSANYRRFMDVCEHKGYKVTEVSAGARFSFGGASAEVLSPKEGGYADLNDDSLCLLLKYGQNSFLLTGDAGTAPELEMAASGRLGHVSLYKAGHHGSDTSSSEALLAAITPDCAVISCGAGNTHGHPADPAVERIAGYTDKIYRTDLQGTIIAESDGEVLKITTER